MPLQARLELKEVGSTKRLEVGENGEAGVQPFDEVLVELMIRRGSDFDVGDVPSTREHSLRKLLGDSPYALRIPL